MASVVEESDSHQNQEKSIKDLLKSLCDVLVFDLINKRLQEILLRLVEAMPEKKTLSKDSPTYLHRLRLTQTFLNERKNRSQKIQDVEGFCKDLEKYIADEQGSCEDKDLDEERSGRRVCWLEEGCTRVVSGIVLRRSPKFAAIYVANPNAESKPGVADEIVVSIPNNFPGFGVVLKIGDVLTVRLTSGVKGIEVVHVSLKSCYSLSKNETEGFLVKAVSILEKDGAPEVLAALTSISSCFAVWSHVVEERCREEVTEKVLTLCCNVVDACSKHLFKTSIEKFLQPFVDSAFLTDSLKRFITDGDKKREKIQMAKKFLCHVTKHHPARCLKVIPLLQYLHPTSADATESNDEFFTKLLTSVAKNVPNAFNQKEPSSLPWNVMPLIPIPNEIQNNRYPKTDHLPKVRKEEKYDSVDQYLDTYFTLLREECFFKLKKGIRGFLNGTLDPKDMALYRVSFECVKFVPKPYFGGLSLALNFECNDPASNSESQNIDRESYEFLKCGNLVCLSLDSSFGQILWACVSENEEIDRGIVSITMFKDHNMESDLDIADVICKLQELKETGVKAYMAESQTFYTAFGHTMDVLQERSNSSSSEKVPFQHSLVDGQTPGPAAYLTAAKTCPDWSGVFSITDEIPVQECTSQYNLLEDFNERMKRDTKPKLDETQLAGLEVALKHKLALIQGPPGTGKTHVGLALLKILRSVNVKQNNKLGPILVVTYKNLALNHFLSKCLEIMPPGTSIVRIGKNWTETEGELRNCTIREVARRLKVSMRTNKEIYRELEDLRMCLLTLSNKLRQAKTFSSTIFREEAEKDQLFSLLHGDGTKTGELSYEKAQQLVYSPNADGQENNFDQQLEEHITNSLKKWLPVENEFSGESYQLSSIAKEPGPNFTKENSVKTSSKPPESVENESQEDVVGSCMEPSADERERLEAIGDEDSDNQDVTQSSLDKDTLTPEWSLPLPPLADETYDQCKPLLNAVKLWELNQHERKYFAQVLTRRFRDRAKQEFLQAQKKYIEKNDELQLLRRQFDARVLKKCAIVGMTVTGATMRSDILANVKPKIVIVEEAAEVLEAQLLAAIPLSVEHLIMIGDQNQLKPQVHHPRLRKEHHMDLSMFERLANLGLPLVQLGYQCRMREEFADVLNKLELYKVPIRTNTKLVAENHPPKCVRSSMFFQTHTEPEEDSKDSHSKCNKREAVHVAKVAKHFCENGYKMDQITVLCSYRGQVNLIKHDFEHKGLQGIEVTTIDSFQGREQDIVLISLVRSKGKNIGYLSSRNRICVAISRARCGMYLFGNDLTLGSKSPSGWKKIIDAMNRPKKFTGNKFPFVEPGKQVKKIDERNIGFKENVETTKEGSPVTKEGCPDRERLQKLASYITIERKRLGRALGLDDNVVDRIEAENEKDVYEQSYKILKRWTEIKGSEATFKALDNALRHETVNRFDLAQKYCYENKGKPKQIDCTTRSGKETKPIQVGEQTKLTRATDDTTAPTEIAESETSIGSGPVKNNAASSAGLARENSHHSGTTDTENPTSITTVAVQEDDKLPSDRVTDEDHKAVNDPLQESQQPHVKGDPHEEVGDLTDFEKKPRSESGNS